MKSLRHGNLVLASGLAWSVVDPLNGGKHKQFAQWRAAGSTHGVGYSIGDVEVFGRTEQAANGLIAIGRLAGIHPKLKGKTALLLIEIPAVSADQESLVVVVGLNRGFVELDKIVFANEVAAIRNSFHTKIGKQFESFGDGKDVGTVGDVITLDDLINGSSESKSKLSLFGGSVRSSRIRPLSSGRTEKVAVGVLVILGIAVGGYMIWERNEEARRIKEQAEQRAQRTPQVIYQQAIDQYLAQPYVPFAQAIKVVREGLQNFPTVFGGWALEKVNCSADVCIAQWIRLSPEGGTLEDFRRRALPEWGPVTAVSQTALSHVIPIQLPTAQWQRADWPKYREWSDSNVDRWQLLAPLGWTADLGGPSLQALPPELNGSQAMGDLNAMPTAIRAAEVTLTNMPFWLADSDSAGPIDGQLMTDHIALHGDIQVVVDEKSVSFSAKGLIHVQN